MNINIIVTNSLRASLLVLLTIILFSACRKNRSVEPQEVAAINVVNASPGPLAINFFLNNNLVNGPALAFTQESGYVLTLAGLNKFDATSGGTTQVVVRDTLQLKTDKYYSLFITGHNLSLSTFLTEDDLSLPSSGKAKIRFLQLSPDGGTLVLRIKGGAILFRAQAYKTASEFVSIDPLAYTFQLEETDGSAIRESSIELMPGKIYTVWSGGLKDGLEINAMGLKIRANN